MDERRQTVTGETFWAEMIGLPPRAFLFTLDQICVMLDLKMQDLKLKHLYFEGRSVGSRSNDLMLTRNIAGERMTPDWRVVDREFVRWMRCKGFRYYSKGGFTS